MVGKDRQSLYLISFRAESLVPFYRWQRQNTRPRCFNQKLVEGIFFSRFWASSMASSRANHPPLSPISSHREIFPRIFFLPALSPRLLCLLPRFSDAYFASSLRRNTSENPTPSAPFPPIISLRKALRVYIYIHVYICVSTSVSGAVCTRAQKEK